MIKLKSLIESNNRNKRMLLRQLNKLRSEYDDGQSIIRAWYSLPVATRNKKEEFDYKIEVLADRLRNIKTQIKQIEINLARIDL